MGKTSSSAKAKLLRQGRYSISKLLGAVFTESFANKVSDGGEAFLAECILGGTLDRVECAIEGLAS